ncbi:antibiotic biosynthesis monooxygenase [Aldersonia kunmingensis]|uniref:antibiotic biosynthesis monooxygenase n=1 Tax=Aldersonia kunmingensis TaxID=408066 RepID=UPI000B27E2FA|nr:antibiotic biosynthesis monooxygenase [Aldersonia kunmingensis]
MFARSTTVVAHPDRINSGIRHISTEVMPTVRSMPGCVGLSMLVDRESRRCIVTSSWRSADDMKASDAELHAVRTRAAEALGGRPQVDEWEILALHRHHRSHYGSCVRATWFRVDAANIDRGVDIFKLASLPALGELDGFCSASLMADRDSGICVSSVTYDSFGAMERTRGAAGTIREAGTTEAHAEILEVCEFELALAHLHVPETV